MRTWIVFAAIVLVAGLAGARYRPDEWYRRLRKPAWTPPDRVFLPVWLLLYLAIATAGWLVFDGNGEAWSTALALWCVQIVLNGAWPWLFFGRRSIGAALADVVLLLAAVAAFIVAAAPISGLAGWLFVPYLAWVAFATALNARVLVLNRNAAA